MFSSGIHDGNDFDNQICSFWLRKSESFHLRHGVGQGGFVKVFPTNELLEALS